MNDVLVNGPGPVWVERAGRLEPTDVVLDRRRDRPARRTGGGPAGPAGRPLDADRRCPPARRLAGPRGPAAVGGRRSVRHDPPLRHRRSPLASFCPPPVADLLAWAVAAGLNMVVCGATSSGKTTLLNALCQHLPFGERVVTVEDTAELRLPGRPRGPARDPAGHARRPAGGEHPRPRAGRAAHAPRPHRRRRGPRRRGPRPPPGDEHRPRRVAVHLPRQRTGRRAPPARDHGLLGGLDLPLAAVREQIVGAVDLSSRRTRRSTVIAGSSVWPRSPTIPTIPAGCAGWPATARSRPACCARTSRGSAGMDLIRPIAGHDGLRAGASPGQPGPPRLAVASEDFRASTRARVGRLVGDAGHDAGRRPSIEVAAGAVAVVGRGGRAVRSRGAGDRRGRSRRKRWLGDAGRALIDRPPKPAPRGARAHGQRRCAPDHHRHRRWQKPLEARTSPSGPSSTRWRA